MITLGMCAARSAVPHVPVKEMFRYTIKFRLDQVVVFNKVCLSEMSYWYTLNIHRLVQMYTSF